MEERKWTYYANLIPGYVEKYGLSGIRERNRKYLGRLRDNPSLQERENLRNLLVENNQPLAMYTSYRWAGRKQSLNKDTRELFQECFIAMMEYIKIIEGNELEPTLFQARLFYRMWNRLWALEKPFRIDEEPVEFLPFEETDFPVEDEKHYGFNTKFIRTLITERETKVITLFFGIGCQPHDLEQIGYKFGLTRERVRQIKEKALQRLEKRIGNLLNTTSLTRDDFFKEQWEQPWNNQLESEIEIQSGINEPSFHSIFYGKNNSALKQ